MLWDKNKVTMIEGRGKLDGDANVVVDGTTYEAGAVILATGSVALAIPGVEFGDRIVDTWGAWSLPSLPKSLIVVGAGASGAEIASGYVRYGTETTLVEMLPQILPAEDKDVVRVVERVFKKQGMNVLTGNPITDVEVGSRLGQGEGRRRGSSRPSTWRSPAAARPTPRTSDSTRPGSRSATAAGSRSTTSSGPRTRRCSRSATWSAAPRSPTRLRRRA